MPRLTGRARILTATATASAVLRREYIESPFEIRQGWLHGDVAYLGVVNCNVRTSVTLGYEEDETWPGPDHRVRNVKWANLYINGDYIDSSDSSYGEYYFVPVMPPFAGGEVDNEGEGSASAEMVVSLHCREWQDHASWGAGGLAEELVSWSGSIDATASITTRLQLEDTGEQPGDPEVSFTVSGTLLVSGSPGTEMPYQHNLLLGGFLDTDQAPESVSCAFELSGDGISYTGNSISASGSDDTLSGSSTSATLEQGGDGSSGASVQAEPDWGYSVTAADRDYETGALMDVTRYHGIRNGVASGQVVGEWGGAGGAYSLSLRNWRIAICGGVTGTNVLTSIHKPVNATETTNEFRVEEDWADAHGSFARSLNLPDGSLYPLQFSPAFTLATIAVAATHRWTLFDDAGKWVSDDSGAAPALDGGFLKLVAGEFNNDWSFWQGGALLYWKNFAYRFARLRVKADRAGAEFSISIHVPRGGFDRAEYTYSFTVAEADTWETKEIDLLFPTAVFDTARTPTDTYYPAHPDHTRRWSALGANVSIHAGTQDTVYWFDYLEGYIETDETRTPLLLTGPHLCLGGYTDAREIDAYEAASTGTFRLFRLVTNGAYCCDLLTSSSTNQKTSWLALFNSLDTAVNDTGITVTYQDNYDTQNAARRDYECAGACWREMTPGAATTIQGRRHKLAPYGYYGSGNFVAGTWGASLGYTIDRVWNGEVDGVFWAGRSTVRGMTVELQDNDTESVRDTAVTDDDGLFRLFYRYGVVKPYSNLPPPVPYGAGTLTPQWTQSGSAPIYAYSYTATGKILNHWWLNDGEMFLLDTDDSRKRFVILDRFASWYDVGSRAGGSGLTETQNGYLFRAYALDGKIWVERSVDAGGTWPAQDPVATDAASLSSPCLIHDRHDNLYVWYHSATSGRCYRSQDYGATWASHATNGGAQWPGAVVLETEMLVGVYVGGEITFSRLSLAGATVAAVPGMTIEDVDNHPFALATDRRGNLHVVYRTTGGALHHRYLLAAGEWSDTTEFASAGAYPSFTPGVMEALFMYWDSNILQAQVSDSTYRGGFDVIVEPHAYRRGTVGVLISRRGDYHAEGRDDGQQHVFSFNRGATWAEPG